ncbi:MAG TPA: prepilin-type N-terminal cleavage/methylation domain-containing protein [Pyrinomonadaceae bacterium]|jgi:prepilin-type N-terminal cleavage/methylation domain-containing protein
MKQKNINSQPRRAGFSLIELMISMVIFMVVITAVYGVMKISLLQRNTTTTNIDAVKSARIALNYIRRDAINAGLGYHNVGGLVPDGFVRKILDASADTDVDDRDLLTGIISGENVTSNSLNTSPNTKMDALGFVTRDLTFNGGNPVSVTGTTTSGSDVVVQTASNTAQLFKLYDLYLIETDISQVVGVVTEVPSSSSFKFGFGTADPLGVNLSATATGSNKSLLAVSNVTGTLKKINMVLYSISPDGVLLRKTYANNTGEPRDAQIQVHELINNVQNFQINYLMDDGTVTSDPSLGNNGRLNQQKMNQVIQMEIIITVLPVSADSRTPTPVTIKEVISARNLRYAVN